ncbi:MAG: kelch repeat-containing protein [Saprospiraceae bacterium]
MKKIYSLIVTFFIPILLFAQWTSSTMPNARGQIISTSADGKLYIAGGSSNTGYLPNILIYDIATDTWDQSILLEEARANVVTTIHGNKLFCAGGIVWETSLEYPQVEIIDIVSKEIIQVDSLSIPRILSSAVSVGNKVLFAGGFDITYIDFTLSELIAFSRVDIYDVDTDTWITVELSEPRGGMAHAVLGNKAYFAGGYKGNGEASSRVDIYDASTDTWTTAELSEARAFYGGGVEADGKVYFAGGLDANNNSSNQIDIYDPATDTWSVDQLSIPRMGVVAAATDGFIVFAGGGDGDSEQFFYTNASNIVDIYNIATGEWDVHFMTDSRINHTTVSSGNQVFILGGYNFFNILNSIEVFTEEITSTNHLDELIKHIKVYPNPTREILNLSNHTQVYTHFQLLNLFGSVLLEFDNEDQDIQIDMTPYDPGIYFIKSISDKTGHHFSKKIIHN